jgi:hypothetical protein
MPEGSRKSFGFGEELGQLDGNQRNDLARELLSISRFIGTDLPTTNQIASE